jgi:signal transduction histidine kinase
MTDRLRLKQIVLNLGRNSAKFVETRSMRLEAEVVDDGTDGPGIPVKKRRRNLYSRFQDCLLC